jgi:hypothetical protein
LVSLAFFPKLLKGISLWLVAWVLGIAVVIFPLFNLQFMVQTLGRGYYIGLLVLLVLIRLLMLCYRKESIKQSLRHLKVDGSQLKEVWKNLKEQKRGSQLFFWIAFAVIVVFTVIAGVDSFSFPTFADDAFGNWNAPALHIFSDGGVKMFGEMNEILGRGRLGYPIHIPLYKAQIATMMGGRYEMGVNVLNFLLFVVLIKLSFLWTWEKTKKAVISILPSLLIVGLPLVFFHITDSYMEFPSAVFSILTVRFLYRYLAERERGNIVLALIFGALLAFTKNDGLVVYLSSIVLVFGATLLFSKQLVTFFR